MRRNPTSPAGGATVKPMRRNARAWRRRLVSNDPICKRSCASMSRSISAIAAWSATGNRSVSAKVLPFSNTDAWPSQARSVVDSPAPAAAYRYAARQRADCDRHSSRRVSALPMVMLLADKFASTVAPATAASPLGGLGTQTSSQISAWTIRPRMSDASHNRSVPNGTVRPPMVMDAAVGAVAADEVAGFVEFPVIRQMDFRHDAEQLRRDGWPGRSYTARRDAAAVRPPAAGASGRRTRRRWCRSRFPPRPAGCVCCNRSLIA